MGTEQLMSLHAQFLDSYRLARWSDLPPGEPYLWDHLAEHLIGAGRGEQLIATVKDGRYLTVKTWVQSANSIETDINTALTEESTDVSLQVLKRTIARISHLLNQCATQNEVRRILHRGIAPQYELSGLCVMLEQDLDKPFLTSWHSLPEMGQAIVLRSLQGHTDWVNGCAVSLDGSYIVSASSDRTLKVWDALTGTERLTLSGHTSGVNGCAVSPDGSYIVSASSDRTLKVWDALTGTERLTFSGHTDSVNGCAVSPDGSYIVSASSDNSLKVWNVQTGVCLDTLFASTGLFACAFCPDNVHIVAGGYSGEVYFLRLLL